MNDGFVNLTLPHVIKMFVISSKKAKSNLHIAINHFHTTVGHRILKMGELTKSFSSSFTDIFKTFSKELFTCEPKIFK
jgi:hypothetical protein